MVLQNWRCQPLTYVIWIFKKIQHFHPPYRVHLQNQKSYFHNIWRKIYEMFSAHLTHCLKSVRIRSYSGPHFPAFGHFFTQRQFQSSNKERKRKHSVHLFLLGGRMGRGRGGGGVEHSTKFFKKGGLTGSQFLERGCWERGLIFLGVLQLLYKKWTNIWNI